MSSTVFDRCVDKAPLAVVTRMLAQDLIGSELDGIFEENRQLQYDSVASFQA